MNVPVRNLSLRLRLWGLFSALCLFIAGSALFNLHNLQAEQRFLETSLIPNLHAREQAEKLRNIAIDLVRLTYLPSAGFDEARLYEVGAQAAAFFDAHEALGTQLRTLPADSPSYAQTLAHHGRIGIGFRHVSGASLSLLADAASGSPVTDSDLARLRFSTDALTDEMSRFVGILASDIDEVVAATRARIAAARQQQLASIVIALLAMAVFMLFLSRQLVRPMRRLVAFVGRAEAAPLEIGERYGQRREGGRDEIAVLGTAIDQLLDRLQEAGVSRDFVDRLFESAPLPLLLVGPGQTIRRSNRRARELHGGAPDGEPIEALLLCDADGEHQWQTRDGRRVTVQVSTSDIFDRQIGGAGLLVGLADLTQRKRIEEALRRQETLLRALAAASSLLLARHGEQPVPDALALVGEAVGADAGGVWEIEARGRTGTDAEAPPLMHPRHAWHRDGTTEWGTCALPAGWHETLAAGQPLECVAATATPPEAAFLSALGAGAAILLPIRVEASLWGAVVLVDGRREGGRGEIETRMLSGLANDVGQLLLQERALAQLRLSARVFAESGEAIAVTDARGNLVSVNRAFTEVTGYAPEEVLGRNPRILQSGRHDAAFYAGMWHRLEATGNWQGEVWNRRKSGEIYPEWLNISAVRGPQGDITHYVAIFSDITERKAAQARIEFLAHHDPLTGLPNRTLLRDRLDQEIGRARRAGTKLGVLFLDLDRFKTINDTLGHAAGDRLLREVADRLRASLRESDIVSRQGGDEFIVLLPDLKCATDAGQAARQIIAALTPPVDVGGQQVHTSFSIGIALFPDDGENGNALLKSADLAMYHAKENERGTYRFFAAELNARAVERMELDNRLREVLRRQEFELFFQPQWSLADGRLTGAEALVRWRCAETLVPPSRFIPIAEDNGLIVPLGAWVLETACRAAVRWHERGHDLTVAVNVSPVQVRRDDIVARVRRVLEETGIHPARLELEITESLMMGDDPQVLQKLTELKRFGIKLAIDDFGTGYSNLAYLRRFNVDRLKIDQSFIRDIDSRADAAAIVGAVVDMGLRLGLNMLAEGVETEAERQCLLAAGCHEMQGYLLGHPMPESGMELLLAGLPR